MNAKITDYRGWEISFDTEKESFYCYSEQYDKDENKKSFAATKKFIDDFLKDNETFTPTWAETKPDSYLSEKKIKLIGIRKDGRFVYETVSGEKKQLSEYDEQKMIIYNPENEKYWKESKQIEDDIEVLRKKKKGIQDKITGVSLSEFKKQFTI